MFLILQFNDLEVLKQREGGVDYLSQKVFDYYPPFTHVNLLMPRDPSNFNPSLISSWVKVIITHSKKRKGVRVEDVKTPTKGQYHLMIPCTVKQLSVINVYLEVILGRTTYCSITMKNAFMAYLLFKMSPRCIRHITLPHPYKNNGWHCSELCLYLLQKADIIDKNIYPFLLSPTELFLIIYHHPRRILENSSKLPFPNNGLEGWENHMKTSPPEIHEDNCLSIQYYADYHLESSTTNNDV